MKKIIFNGLVAFLLSVIAIQSFGQSYLEYTIDGVPYKIDEGKFISYGSYNKDMDQKTLCKSASASVSGIYDILFTAEIRIYIDTNKTFTKETFKLAESIAYYERTNIAHLEMVKHPTSDTYEWYRSENESKGNVTITKVNGDIIEGTFEGVLKSQFPNHENPPIHVTNGKFRFSVDMMITEDY